MMTLEVAQHLGDNLVRTIARSPPTASCVYPRRGTGAPISVPVGDVTKSHVFNVTGDVLNLPKKGGPRRQERWPIRATGLRPARARAKMFETGIRSSACYLRAARSAFWWRGRPVKTVLIQEMIQRVARTTAVSPCSPASASDAYPARQRPHR